MAYAYSGPSRDFRAVPTFDPVLQALEDEKASRAPAGPPLRFDTSLMDQDAQRQTEDDRFQATVATTPGMRSLADTTTGDVGGNPREWERAALEPKTFRQGGFGGKTYQFDPRLAIGTELARARAERSSALEDAVPQANAKLAEDDARVARLVAAGYSQREAVRQVHGGPRTVAEEQEILQTRSSAQMERDQMIQGEITARQQALQGQRANVQMLLERSRAGDRKATLELRRAQILLNQSNREYQEAQRFQMMNATGYDLPGSADADANLNATVEQHLGEVGSMDPGRRAAVEGVRTAGTDAAPAAPAGPVISDDQVKAALDGVGAPPVPPARQPAPVAGSSTTGTRAAGPAAAKRRPSQKLIDFAKGDPGKKAYLASQGYDVSEIP